MAGATNQQQSMSPKDMFIVTLFQHLFMTVVSCFLCYSLALKIHSYYLLPPEEERWEEENRFSAKNIRIRIMFLFNLLRSWHHLRNIIIGRIITPLLYLFFLPLTLILKGFLIDFGFRVGSKFRYILLLKCHHYFDRFWHQFLEHFGTHF